MTSYGEEMKSMRIGTSGKIHAEFKIKLLYDNFSQHEFLHAIIKAYLEDQEDFMKFLEVIKEKKTRRMNNVRRKIAKKELREKREIERIFALTGEDVESIFDLLERETNI